MGVVSETIKTNNIESTYNKPAEDFIALKDSRNTEEKQGILSLVNSTISDCSKEGGRLLHCLPSALIGRPVSSVLPELAKVKLLHYGWVNQYLLSLSRIGHHFEVRRICGTCFSANLYFSEVSKMSECELCVIICPVRA